MFTHLLPNILVKIRNASLAKKKEVSVALSNLSISVVRILKEKGKIRDFAIQKKGSNFSIVLRLLYRNDVSAIRSIQLCSRSGLRNYKSRTQLKQYAKHMGFTIVTTTKGPMTGEAAINLGLGGEMLCSVY